MGPEWVEAPNIYVSTISYARIFNANADCNLKNIENHITL